METKTLENIKKQCALRGMTIASLERRLDYSNGSIAKAKTLPSDRLYEISKFFGVTMEYMMFCGTDTPFEADRYIPLNDRLVSIYRRFYSDGYVFHSKDSLVLRKQTRDRWWKYFVRELDIEMGAKLYRNKIIESKVAPDLSPYMLRHTFATRMATKIDVNALAQIMGHSNIQVTYQYYLHYDEKNMEKIRNAM